MNNKNSKIYLCKDINLDREYKNVLSYTEQEMLTLCIEKSIVSATNFSFIRQDRNEIQVEFSYATCLQCNYMAFQNPNYSNKWFFAFIDEVSYVGDKTTKITFTVDEHATWYDYWYTKPCLVLREHVNSDSVGEHTYPENLEHGEYVINNVEMYGNMSAPTCYPVVATTWLPSNTPGLSNAVIHGGVVSGAYYIVFETNTDAHNFIEALNGFSKTSAIISVFMIPSFLIAPISSWYTASLNSYVNNSSGGLDPHTFTCKFALLPNSIGGVNHPSSKTISLNQTINGYTPKNKKLYTRQFNYLLMSNNNGGSAEFSYENFTNNAPTFQIVGMVSIGCSIKCYPTNYKSYTHPVGTDIIEGFNEGLMAGKFPQGSYQNDSFINWMTQQSVNTKMNQVSTAVKLASTLLTGSDDVTSGGLFQQQASYLNERYQHALVPPQAVGNINGSDITFAMNQMNFTFYQMSIKSEYARKLDAYFNKFGYQVNEIKSPNVTGRTYWNFIQIGPYEEIGYSNNLGSVPAKSMDIINRIYRNGVTIWHDHSNVGNYTLDNSL